MGLAWTEELSVGNAMLDSDHKHLICMVNSVQNELKAKDSAGLSRSLQLLFDGMRIHFENEKNVARVIGFPFAEHDLSHQYMLKKLQYMKDVLEGGNGTLPDGLAEYFHNFLNDWAAGHITNEDGLMKTTLKTYPCDFKPDNH